MKKTSQDASPIYIGELNGTCLGNFRIAASDFGLVAVEWAESQGEFDSYLARLKRPVVEDAKRIKPYAKELAEYIEGKRRAFTISIGLASPRSSARRCKPCSASRTAKHGRISTLPSRSTVRARIAQWAARTP